MIEFTFRPIDVWPGERTRGRKGSQFRSRWSATLELLKRELRHLRANRPVIQIDLTERDFRVSDGLPRAAARPETPGVIMSFDSRVGPLRYCCDTYTAWQDNVRAIAMTLENLRAVDRYGATTRRGEQYAGFRALPAPDDNGFATAEDAAAFILKAAEFNGSSAAFLAAPGDVRRSAYRAAAKKLHPDSGGDADQFAKFQRAKEILEATR